MGPADAVPTAASAAFALGLLIKSTLILGVGWAVAAGARRGSAAVRHGVWVAALIAVATLPLGALWLPRLEVELPAVLRALPTASRGEPTPVLAAPSPAAAVTTAAAGAAAAGGVTAQTVERSRARGTDPSLSDLGLILWAIWMIGLLGRALWLGAHLLRVRRIVAGAHAVDGVRAAVAAAAARTIGVQRRVLLLESDRVGTPVTCGIRRPVILLPPASDAWSEARLRVVLLHELAHIRRRDYLCSLIAEVAAAFYWPVPLVWVARAAVHAEQELASDDLVLASGTPPVEYADHLLAVARSLRPGATGLVATLGMAREIGLKRRIRTILDRGTRRAPLASISGLLVVGTRSLFTLPLAALSPAGNSTERAASSPLTPPAARAETLEEQSVAAPAPPAATHLWVEAEDAVLTGETVLGDDLDTSAGHYIWLDEGGEARLPLRLPAGGTGTLWARVRPRGDAVLAGSLDQGPWAVAADATSGASGEEWRWVSLPLALGATDSRGTPETRGPGAAPTEPEPTATLRLASRDGTVRVDRIVLTTDPGFVPTSRGPQPEGFAPVYRWIDVPAGPLLETTEFAVDLPTAGRYVLWGRVMGADGGANSLFLSVDDGAPMVWDAPRQELEGDEGRWTWDPASARELEGRGVNPLVLELTAGRHLLRLAPRERGTGLAGLLLTNDLTIRPRGRTPGSPAVQLWLEAEDAQPVESLRFRRGGGALGEGYLQAEDRDDDRSDPDDDEAAEIRFQLASAGVYTLWGRTLARRDTEDSFWIRVNGGRWVRWNGIPLGSDWQWSAVHDGDGQDDDPWQIALPAGENWIEIARREGGAGLDRFLLTNEDHFDPRGLGTE